MILVSRRDAQHLLQRREAFADAVRVRRQAEVHDDHRRRFALHDGDRLRPGVGDQHVMGRECPAVLRAQALIVFDDQQLGLDGAWRRSCSAAAGSATPALHRRDDEPHRGSDAGAADHQQIAAGIAQQLPRLIRADAMAAALVVRNGRNSESRTNSGVMPGPSSTMSTTSVSASTRSTDRARVRPCCDASIALFSRWLTTASNASGSIAAPAPLLSSCRASVTADGRRDAVLSVRASGCRA